MKNNQTMVVPIRCGYGMKWGLTSVFLILAAFSICSAEQFCIEDESLKPVPAVVVRTILATEKDSDWKTCKFIGKQIDLDGQGKAEDYVVTTADGCLCGNVLCTIWVLRRTGGSYVVVLSDGGYSMKLLKQRHNGLADIFLEASSAGWSQQSSWQFDGKQYVRVKQKIETQD